MSGKAPGYDYDNYRMAREGHSDTAQPYADLTNMCRPRQDTPGLEHYSNFGSVHANSFSMIFCDESVQPIGYAIDPAIHYYLSGRNDGKPIDAKAAAF